MSFQWYTSNFSKSIKDNLLRIYTQGTENVSYCAPVISNGTLYTQLDFCGTQKQSIPYTNHGVRKVNVDLTPGVFVAGRRYDTMLRQLIAFGYFEEKCLVDNNVLEKNSNAQQVLDLYNGATGCKVEYKNNLGITTFAFVHSQYPMIAVRKNFSDVPKNFTYSFDYNYALQGNETTPVKWSDYTIKALSDGSGAVISYEIDGVQKFLGTITVLTPNCKPEIKIEDNRIALVFNNVPETLDFYLLYNDSYDGNDYVTEQQQLISKVTNESFESLFLEHSKDWNEFWNGFSLEIPNQKMEDVFYSAMYNLKCTSTPWGIPVGVHPYSWNGNYFAFNLFTEVFCMLNDRNSAIKIPKFRYKTLKNAIARTTNWSFSAGAKYPWQSDEDGFFECASPGVWNDHIFHMGNIAIEAFEYYNYTNDLSFLNEIAYPIIKECAKFFMLQSIYTIDDGKKIIGKCCDLEKFGTARENAFLTTCGVIKTLDIAAKTAQILGVDNELIEDWLNIAKSLKENLPHDGKMYIGYKNCQEKSIGVLGGIYPYWVLNPDDPKQLSAIEDYMDSATAVGNMYPYGKNICTWYASWVAITLIRLNQGDRALEFLNKAAISTGAFDIVYEINEPGIFVSHPWCSAPPACYAQSLLELLCREENDTLILCSNLENIWKDISFTLTAPDDLTVTLKIKNSKVEILTVKANSNYSGRIKNIKLWNYSQSFEVKPNSSINLLS